MAFERPTTTQTPDEIFDYWLSRLTHAELCCLLYIVRKTFGFGKGVAGDAISLDQFCKGVKRSNGEGMWDEGCGIKNRSHVCKALVSLEAKDLVERFQQTTSNGGAAPTLYRLKFRPPASSTDPGTGECRNGHRGGAEMGTGGVPKWAQGGVPKSVLGGVPISAPTINTVTINTVTTDNEQHTLLQQEAAADAAAGAQEGTDADGEVRGPANEGGEQGRQLVLIEEVRMTKDAEKERAPKKTKAAKKTQETPPSPSFAGEQEEKLPPGRHRGAVREGVEHQEGESPEDYAAREYLARVRGWTSCGRPVYVRWRLDLAPVVQEIGTAAFSDWITWLISDPWYKENAYKLRPARLLQEFDDWWNLPEPRPLRRKVWAPKRDDGRVSNSAQQPADLQVCISCNGELGTKHQDFCVLVKRGVVRAGSPITREHCDEKWAIPALHDSRRRGAV